MSDHKCDGIIRTDEEGYQGSKPCNKPATHLSKAGWIGWLCDDCWAIGGITILRDCHAPIGVFPLPGFPGTYVADPATFQKLKEFFSKELIDRALRLLPLPLTGLKGTDSELQMACDETATEDWLGLEPELDDHGQPRIPREHALDTPECWCGKTHQIGT